MLQKQHKLPFHPQRLLLLRHLRGALGLPRCSGFFCTSLIKAWKVAATAARRAGWDLLHILLLLENSSHHYHKRHDFPAEQLMPTASGFTMDQGNVKFSLLFPICSVLCLSPLLRQTMTEVSAQNLGVGWRSGKGEFPFSEHYHSPLGLFCHCRAEGPSPHLAAHQGRNEACPCFKSKHVFSVEADDSRVSAALEADSGSNPCTLMPNNSAGMWGTGI